MIQPPSELTAAQLRRRMQLTSLPFATTADAPELNEIIGQERATRAIEFGIEIPYQGYNIFAMGPVGAGKTTIITGFLERKARTRSVPADWGYAHNFNDPDRPEALQLPPGGGARLRDDIDQLLNQVSDTLIKAFASEQYAEHRNALVRQSDQLRTDHLRQLDQFAREQGFVLVRLPMGLMVAPLKDGQAMTQEQYEALSEEEKQVFQAREPVLQEALERTMRQVQEINEEAQVRLANLDREIAAVTTRPLFDKVMQPYADWPEIVEFLQGVHTHISEHTDDLRRTETEEEDSGEQEGEGESTVNKAPSLWFRPTAGTPYDRYRLNVIVDNSGLQGAPVILETNPTYLNLIGRVEMRAEYGTLVTNFRQIKAGALHRANGGYLVLDARSLLRQPLAWEALKQALRNQRIRIEEMGQQMGVLATASLAPEPIPLDVKVVLIGDPTTYYLLYEYDEQFEKLFKVRADFAVEMAWTAENEQKVAQFIRNRCEEEKLPHFDISAVSKVIEYSARLVEDQRKLTTRFAHVTDIVREAAFWAQRAGHSLATGDDVDKAINERTNRSNQFEERLREMIADGKIMIATAGEVVGQINGLAVLQLGDYSFGRPSRITARTYEGRSGVISIEREARMSGRVHDKGTLILTGFLGGQYAQDKPLSLSASITFEQAYDSIDGDSASAAELIALLSSLAEAPIKQALAITGSINQRGDIQAIGGVSDKIEGFFETCKAAPPGLTGAQGVVIPASNVSNLMLKEEIVQAVAAGQFHIYPVQTLDEAIGLMTGMPAGARGADGVFPADTINGRVDRRLRQLAEQLQRFGRSPAKENNQKPALSPREPEKQPPHEPELPTEAPEPVEPTVSARRMI